MLIYRNVAHFSVRAEIEDKEIVANLMSMEVPRGVLELTLNVIELGFKHRSPKCRAFPLRLLLRSPPPFSGSL